MAAGWEMYNYTLFIIALTFWLIRHDIIKFSSIFVLQKFDTVEIEHNLDEKIRNLIKETFY